MSFQKTACPDFFIIGAPKSATTALSEYLRQHPQVLFSRPKEPHFFNDDFSHRHIELMDDYLGCFSHGNGQESAVGEGSVFYLYSRTAVPNILGYNPDARFIVMLRDPVEAVYSWHWQVLFSFGEDQEDFETAWRMQEIRQLGRMLPPRNRVREALLYGALFSYASQLNRLFDLVPRERILILLYDDFRDAPETIYLQTLSFLSLASFRLPSYQRVNAGKRLRWPLFETMVQTGGRLKLAMGISSAFGILAFMRRLNTRYQERPPLEPKFRLELIEYFRDDVRLTADLIGRDLTRWTHD